MGKITFEEVPFYIEMILEKVTALEKLVAALKEPERKAHRLLTIQEAAEVVNLKVSTIYGKIGRKEIPHIKMDKKLMFEEDVLLEWIRHRSQEYQSSSLYSKAKDFLKKGRTLRR